MRQGELALCPHERRGFRRVPWVTGDGYHVVECCADCGAALRGRGVWVSHAEVWSAGLDPQTLPLR
jgi:hypothetical protein